MRAKHVRFLVDPLTHEPLELTDFERSGDHVLSGLLSNTSNWYPIIGGIPRLLTGPLKKDLLQRHHVFLSTWKAQLPPAVHAEWQKAIGEIKNFDQFVKHLTKTGASFAFEWEKIYRENSFEKQNFLHFIGPYITEETFKGKTVLDVGCGSGRFTKQAIACGAAMAIGSDVGESVKVAYQLTKEYENACIIQADIYRMPFKPIFDIAYSIGVIHHLPDPEAGFHLLKSVARPGGLVAIWVYNRRHNTRARYLYEPVRVIIKRLPKRVVYYLSYGPALLTHGLNGITHLLNKVGAKDLAKRIPFSYYANFPFNMKLNDTFDIVATPKNNYYFRETIVEWFKKSGLHTIQAFEHPEAGITCQGVKPD